MRSFLVVTAALLLASCRPKPRAGDPPRDAEASLPEASVASTARPSFAAPLSAARIPGATLVVARDRRGPGWVLSNIVDTAPADSAATKIEIGEDPELYSASGEVAVVARDVTEGKSGRSLRRVVRGDAGPSLGEALTVGDAVCATFDGYRWLQREGSGFRGAERPAASDADVPGPMFPSRSEVTLVCGQRLAFVADHVEGQVRTLAWSSQPARLVTLPKPPIAPDDLLMAAMEDRLVLAALKGSVLAIAVLGPDETTARWQKVALPGSEEITLEAIEPNAGKVGLLLLRTVPAVKACRNADANDTVAEVAIFDVQTGKLARPERVETWRCGAEPGPFFSGWAAGKLIVGWPRGADAACVRARVRWGGLGFAAVDPASGRAKVGHTGSAGESIVEAGCDDQKCYAVTLTRGRDPCGPADGPEAGRLEVVAYPQ